MFQTFEDQSEGARAAERLEALRAELIKHQLDGFIVPHSDEYQNEYLPPNAERLSWISGFTGSAGMVIVLKDRAAIFVDGRYTLQVQDQVDADLFEIHHLIEMPPANWLETTLQPGQRIGYDAWLHTSNSVKRLKQACEKAKAELVSVVQNPLDTVWTDRPPAPQAKMRVHDSKFAGRDSTDKRTEIGKTLGEHKCDAAIISAPPSIAWLFNIRGGDVSHTPLVLASAILNQDGTADLFVDPEKVTDEVRVHLGNDVSLKTPGQLPDRLHELGRKNAIVWVDPHSTPSWFLDQLESHGAKLTRRQDPCALPKAVKNPVEVEGTKAAHRRDGAALAKFLAWLDTEGPTGSVDEISAVKKLESFRRENPELEDISFETISGSGPNGAIVHYRVTEASNRTLKKGELFLVDSGAQYQDGTTDVTRTISIGTPNEEMRDRFTRVLKGHIALSSARFPKGTNGATLDILARKALWDAGFDYDHGTGHGVGSFLSVHEGPQGIHKRSTDIELQPGMIVSNEPGYYKTDGYGIRIENLIVVTEAKDIDGGERPMMGFEELTLAPIDRRLVNPSMLSSQDLDWLNAYHTRVEAEISPLVDARTKAWLKGATKKIIA